MIEVSFLGDISLNGKYNSYYRDKVKPFDELKEYLSKSDYVIGNLECMCSGIDGENLLKKPRLKTDMQTLQYLKDINLSMVTLAHNHIYDNLESGFNNTIIKLKELGIKTIGASKSFEEVSKPLILEENNIRIGYLNYVHSDTNPNTPDDARVYTNTFDIDNIKKDIKIIRTKVDYVICLFHWGGRLEKGMYPDYNQPNMAYEIIDSGADLIVGHHSHTLQPYEIYKGKYIFYSLGNFCFSDIHSDGKIHEINQDIECKSIILNVKFYKESYAVDIKHIRNERLFILFDENKKTKKKYQNRINFFHFMKNKKWMWKLYFMKYRHYNPIKFYFFENNRNPLGQLRKLDIQKIKNYISKKIKGKV